MIERRGEERRGLNVRLHVYMRGEINPRHNAPKVRCLSSPPRFLVLVFRLFLATTRMRCMRTSQHEIQHADGYLAVCLNYYSEETKLYGVMVRLFLYFFARLTGKLLLWLWLPTSEFIGFQITAFRAARPK
jgi:hypothetical protein